jgi:transcriptional regulator with XRE-family HTH domain
MTEYNFAKLKGRMTECGYTHKKMAKALGLSDASFSYKINGKRDFTLKELNIMARVLNMDDVMPYFFTDVLKLS